MTNRKVHYIVKDQMPLILPDDASVKEACCRMWEKCVGSVLVQDAKGKLAGIFTGRDAVRFLAKGLDDAGAPLSEAMTRNPITITPEQRAIDALRLMSEHGFRHLPVVDGDKIWGIVSRGDFKGQEIEHLDHEQHLWECIR
ncbi:MAG: CBS domain-containing protein [Hyphomicrobiaceae bacterium]